MFGCDFLFYLKLFSILKMYLQIGKGCLDVFFFVFDLFKAKIPLFLVKKTLVFVKIWSYAVMVKPTYAHDVEMFLECFKKFETSRIF